MLIQVHPCLPHMPHLSFSKPLSSLPFMTSLSNESLPMPCQIYLPIRVIFPDLIVRQELFLPDGLEFKIHVEGKKKVTIPCQQVFEAAMLGLMDQNDLHTFLYLRRIEKRDYLVGIRPSLMEPHHKAKTLNQSCYLKTARFYPSFFLWFCASFYSLGCEKTFMMNRK